MTDIGIMEVDYDAGNYYETAAEAAAVAQLALPLPSLSQVQCADFPMSTVEIADFIGGFIEGFTGNNHKTELEGCFKDTDAFE